MAENYSLNSRFGMNVSVNSAQKKPLAQAGAELAQNVGELFDSMTSYVAKYENVFNGDVEREINMYARQSMIVGMNLRAGETRRQFDVNI